MTDRIVVVGASLAGLRAAETLRTDGYAGEVVVVGDEPHRPYDRPPLSKQILTGEWTADRIGLAAASKDDLDLTWRLGNDATGLDVDGRSVDLADGTTLEADGVVVATGASPRRLPGTDDLDGIITLRTLDDASALATRVAVDGVRVAVVGAGFIGSEVAASCRSLGREVTLIEPLPQPLARVLGEPVGAVVAELHRANGVDVRLGVGVEGVFGDGRDGVGGSEVTGLRLSDGTTVDADVVVVGIGVQPNTAWLEGSGLLVDDGVVCDPTTLAAPGIVAAGDVARWPNPAFEGELMRVEHWDHAISMGAHAARRLLAGDGPGEPFATVPWFWSDQYDRKFQLAGRVRADDEVAMVAGSFADDRFCALFGRDGRVTGALGMNMPAKVTRYRPRIADGLGWDEALAELS